MQCVVRSSIHLGFQVSFFFMEKRLAVSDQILQIAELRTVNRREVGFRDDALDKREPHSAGGRISGANSLFVAVCPTGFEARPPKSYLLIRAGHQDPPLKLLRARRFVGAPRIHATPHTWKGLSMFCGSLPFNPK